MEDAIPTLGGVKLFIKYDNLDLLELFWSDAETLTGNIDDGEVMYRREMDNFKLTIFLYTYELRCSIFLSYKDDNVLSVKLKNISELKKNDEKLYFFDKDELKLTINFEKNFFCRYSKIIINKVGF